MGFASSKSVPTSSFVHVRAKCKRTLSNLCRASFRDGKLQWFLILTEESQGGPSLIYQRKWLEGFLLRVTTEWQILWCSGTYMLAFLLSFCFTHKLWLRTRIFLGFGYGFEQSFLLGSHTKPHAFLKIDAYGLQVSILALRAFNLVWLRFR